MEAFVGAAAVEGGGPLHAFAGSADGSTWVQACKNE